jgi:integrase/recombinase XerD
MTANHVEYPRPTHITSKAFDIVQTSLTTSFDAGVALRDVQVAARHADPRTTTRYDRARNNLDRHASYIVTAFIAGAS